MSELSLKQTIKEMSLAGVQELVEIIRSRPDVEDIFIVTKKDSEEMSTHFRDLFKHLGDTHEPA